MASSARAWLASAILPVVFGLIVGYTFTPQPVGGTDPYETSCHDRVDNDADSMIDCEDIEDCSFDYHCEEICNDQIDNDGDLAVDCGDWWCQVYDPSC